MGDMDGFLSKMISEFEKVGGNDQVHVVINLTPSPHSVACHDQDNIDQLVTKMMGEMLSKENMYAPMKEITKQV